MNSLNKSKGTGTRVYAHIHIRSLLPLFSIDAWHQSCIKSRLSMKTAQKRLPLVRGPFVTGQPGWNKYVLKGMGKVKCWSLGSPPGRKLVSQEETCTCRSPCRKYRSQHNDGIEVDSTTPWRKCLGVITAALFSGENPENILDLVGGVGGGLCFSLSLCPMWPH